ncbi:MAG: sugar porter family MFS transporter [Gammaproteobacteria bacterium]|nr:sugar porter family MFS transporter [Gammaproteobacteria bacterium]
MKTVNSFTFFIIACAGLGGILYGYDIGVISGAMLFIQKSIPMTQSQLGVIVGGMLSGCMVSTLVAGQLADSFGRKTMIIAACSIFAVGIICILSAQSFAMLFSARLLLGVGVGIVSVAVPLYLSEIAPANIRGRSITTFQLLLTFGIVFAYFIDLLFTPSGNWRAMFAVILIPVAILLISMLFLPETPRWLLSKNRRNDAEKVLLKTQSIDESKIELELEQIETALKTTKESWRALFARNLWLPLFVSLAIAICNQLTAINVLLQYAPLIIKKAGFHSDVFSMFGTIGIGSVNFLTTILAFFLIDRFGRRKLLITGTSGIIIAYLFLGFLPYLGFAEQTQAQLSFAGLITYIFFFAIGPGAVVWLAMSELLPTKVRGKGLALALFLNSLTSALLSTLFLPLQQFLGMSGSYFLFAGCTVVYFLVATFLLPETKNKTLEEIQLFYEKLIPKTKSSS